MIDEFDVICGVRESGASSGNAYLIRTLTDDWLRALDDHPSVPLIATVNDVLAVDDAVRRRFAFVFHVSDALSPSQERLAWTTNLHCEPPNSWQPVGAAVADFALVRNRCRMLGLSNAPSLASAIARARDARLGPSSKATVPERTRKAVH